MSVILRAAACLTHAAPRALRAQGARHVLGAISAHARTCVSVAPGPELSETTQEQAIPGVTRGGDKLTMLFTCTVCDTRSAKVISKAAYTKGVVLAQCPGCKNNHLIADHLGWFESDSVTVEQLLAAKGESITKTEFTASGGVVELSEEDLAILGTGAPRMGTPPSDGEQR